MKENHIFTGFFNKHCSFVQLLYWNSFWVLNMSLSFFFNGIDSIWFWDLHTYFWRLTLASISTQTCLECNRILSWNCETHRDKTALLSFDSHWYVFKLEKRYIIKLTLFYASRMLIVERNIVNNKKCIKIKIQNV